MVWTETTRTKYERESSRYQSDLTDEEWALLAPHLEGSPRSTVYRWFARRCDDRTCITINHLLLMQVREKLGREANPIAGAIDTQSVKTTESSGPWGFDVSKKVKGRKREIVVDTEGHYTHIPSELASFSSSTEGIFPVDDRGSCSENTI